MISEDEIRSIVEKLLSEVKTVDEDGKFTLNTVEILNPKDKDALEGFVKTTPARICVGRSGDRPTTNSFLEFQVDHANAVDSVFNDVSEEVLNQLNILQLKTKVVSRDQHLTRPDLGRDLDEVSKKILLKNCEKNPEVQIIISDGLSSKAVEANIKDLLKSFIQGLELYDIKTGTPVYVKYGRVGVMDIIGEYLNAECAVIFIGERPGMTTAESISAYITYKPRRGIQESERTVLSNIHKGGTPPAEAGAESAAIVKEVLENKKSGIKL